ncbi:MFS transporter [Mangrovibacillus cuniculi]|uniref:MFS transporter n=1 Tax=Mangrovibacillus cuniculi TaxID=2593652 RepID=A0A7S8CBR9_9BACI|nr:MFS transporter [Mangrovibacillus cuniculi]QPC46888.1 MFS transporter [Mangrovibacillus cuniculi]
MKKFRLLGDVEPSKDLYLLLWIGGLYSLSIALSNTFVNVFIWKQSGDYVQLGIYNLLIVIFQPLTFVLAGRWAKKIDRVLVLRIGVVALAIFYIVVLLLKENASSYLLLFGALLGTGYGFYWLSFNVLTFEITEPETRDFFNGFLGILTSFGGIVGPFFAGWVIARLVGNTGYTVIFSVSLFLFAIAVVLSFFLKPRPAKGRYDLVTVFKERKNNINWRMVTWAHFFQGLREGTFIFVVSIFVFITTESELALGTFGLVNSGIAFVAYYAVSRFLKPKFRLKGMLIGGMLLYAVIFLLLFDLTFVKLIIYAVCIAVAYPLLLVPYISMTYDVIGKSKDAGEKRIEYVVIRELFLNGGRITSILAFIVAVGVFDEAKSLPYLLLIIGSGHTWIYFFMRRVKV